MADKDSSIFKLLITLPLLAFFNTLPILIIIHDKSGSITIAPLLLLNLIVFYDIFTRRHSKHKDSFNKNVLLLSFLMFPVALALPYFENSLLRASGISIPMLAIGLAVEASGGAVSAIVISVALFMILNKRANLEEKLLEEKFGDEYRKYRDSTGKYLPNINSLRGG